MSININSIRGKKLELLAFLDFHQPQIVAIQETKIDSSISTSELFPESCPYNVYRKDRTVDGGGVVLLIHKNISHMPTTKLKVPLKSVNCFRGRRFLKGFYLICIWRPSWSCDQYYLNEFSFPCT